MEFFMLSFAGGVAAGMLLIAVLERYPHALGLVFLFLLASVLWFGWAFYGAEYLVEHIGNTSPVADGKEDSKLARLGQVGDLFGGVNALFAAFAFAGVVFAGVMQARTLVIASKQQLQQSFEPLLFHLLELHREVSAVRLKLSPKTGKLKVQAAPSGEVSVEFPRALNLLRRAIRMRTVGVEFDRNGQEKLTRVTSEIYSFFYEANQDELGPHFRSLYHVFKLIDGSSFDEETKIRYANIARSTLGRDQLFLLAVNCTAPHGREFKPLVEAYGLLKHVDRRSTALNIDERVAAWCFAPSALLGAEERKLALKPK